MKIKKVRNVKTPTRGTLFSAGIDFYIPEDFTPVQVFPQDDLLIPSGIVADIPANYVLIGADKSGVVTSANAMRRISRTVKPGSFESSLIVGAKVVDEDYTGEIHIHLINVGQYPVELKPGMKIAQFILVPVSYECIEVMDDKWQLPNKSERGNGAFASTGRY